MAQVIYFQNYDTQNALLKYIHVPGCETSIPRLLNTSAFVIGRSGDNNIGFLLRFRESRVP